MSPDRVDRLWASMDQLQAEFDRLRKLLAATMAAVVCLLVMVELGKGRR